MTNIVNKESTIDIEVEMQRSYLDYSMSVIVSRALPDVRDGLKLVHKRILYSMYEAGFFHNKPPKKSARIVGDVIGKYHPHGEVAVYDALVRLAQDFSLRYPLIDGQGNFGSIDGDGAAASRYTEARLTKLANHLLNDLDKNTVKFRPNYDNSEQEPTVLPAAFPNLLVNGAGGIAVGMATNIPPHNLSEVLEACILYLENNDVSIVEIMGIIKGPDFPTAGIVIADIGLYKAYTEGKGIIQVRGRVKIEDNSSTKNRSNIVIYEIPYMVNKAKLVENIAQLVNDKKIEGVSDLRDESDRFGIRIVIEIKNGVIADLVINQLYSFTALQSSFGIQMLALDADSMPRTMNLKEIIKNFVQFRKEVVIKRTSYLLNQAKNKAHIQLGLYLAVNDIDKVVAIIRSSKNAEEAKEKLISHPFDIKIVRDYLHIVNYRLISEDTRIIHLKEDQAKAILEMKLSRITNLEKEKISHELNKLANEIKEYLEILGSETKLLSIIKDEFLEIKKDFPSPRMTEISDVLLKDQEIEDLIPKEDMVVTVTLNGYIKRVPLDTYKLQKRGGKGRSAAIIKEEDLLSNMFVANTHTPLLFFSNYGQVYALKLYKLPLSNPQNRGRPIINLLKVQDNENITNILPLPEDDSKRKQLSIIFATKKGNIRRNLLSDFESIKANGKIAIKLEQDELVSVQICNQDSHILLATREGKAIVFSVDSLRIFKNRTSSGVKGLTLKGSDVVINMTVIDNYSSDFRSSYLAIPIETRLKIFENPEIAKKYVSDQLTMEQIIETAANEEFILTVSSNGYGKLTSVYEYRVTNRGGSGVINMGINNKSGVVISALTVKSADEVILSTSAGKAIRISVGDIRITKSRGASGVILCKIEDKNEQVIGATLIYDK